MSSTSTLIYTQLIQSKWEKLLFLEYNFAKTTEAQVTKICSCSSYENSVCSLNVQNILFKTFKKLGKR